MKHPQSFPPATQSTKSMQRFDKAVCLDNKSAITTCNHFIRYSMDDTVREMRKQRAAAPASVAVRVLVGCGCACETQRMHVLAVTGSGTDEALVYVSGTVWGPQG